MLLCGETFLEEAAHSDMPFVKKNLVRFVEPRISQTYLLPLSFVGSALTFCRIDASQDALREVLD